MPIPPLSRACALAFLARACGFESTVELLDHYKGKPVCPAICLTCQYTEEHEVFVEGPWCPRCDEYTMVTAVDLAHAI